MNIFPDASSVGRKAALHGRLLHCQEVLQPKSWLHGNSRNGIVSALGCYRQQPEIQLFWFSYQEVLVNEPDAQSRARSWVVYSRYGIFRC
jgi:hypothetical protein